MLKLNLVNLNLKSTKFKFKKFGFVRERPLTHFKFQIECPHEQLAYSYIHELIHYCVKIKIIVVESGFEPDRLTELVRVTPLCIALLVLAEFLIICF